MGIYDYKNFTGDASKALYTDAMALARYVNAPSSPVESPGWVAINAEQLGYSGPVDNAGIFTGRGAACTADAVVLGKYEAEKLVAIGISFRGTGVGGTFNDIAGDLFSNAMTAFVGDYANNYVKYGFDDLLGKVADYAQSQGLGGHNVLVTGHSQGGTGVNSLAALSADNWNGFYQEANYVAFASPTQSPGNQVLNIGYENDPVFRVLDGTSLKLSSLGVHDKVQAMATNNIVNFNDHYVSASGDKPGIFGFFTKPLGLFASWINNFTNDPVTGAISDWFAPQSLLNPGSWKAHFIDGYSDGLNRLVNSEFYNLTSLNSTVIVSNLSSGKRGDTWVEDLNRFAEKHTGSTFIIGTDSRDKIKGGSNNDYLEGWGGDDDFRDGGGYNVILGGSGNNTYHIQSTLPHFSFANDGDGTLYIRANSGGISTTRDIGTVIVDEWERRWWGGSDRYDSANKVTEQGLISSNGKLTQYASSVKGDAHDNVLKANAVGDWLFGQGGDDHLIGGKGNDVFVGGFGNDLMISGGGRDTFLFYGAFGKDKIEGYSADDKLVFQGIAGLEQDYDYRSYASAAGNDTLLSFGADSVTLVGVDLNHLNGGNIVIA
ncbi:polyurethanase [Pseudomonas sp. SK3(2021)]|uniref:polyurethanase n=1 Tax=Pseudomonas sp. SK3(2021) TaxID=2841064 RepID=UPI00192CC99E|nr:polyurethanase [Pseudomonas sp. SK3(2021)]QQZ44284.1 polyurethanase [Pseudomonas sp. SK3(2021)]